MNNNNKRKKASFSEEDLRNLVLPLQLTSPHTQSMETDAHHYRDDDDRYVSLENGKHQN